MTPTLTAEQIKEIRYIGVRFWCMQQNPPLESSDIESALCAAALRAHPAESVDSNARLLELVNVLLNFKNPTRAEVEAEIVTDEELAPQVAKLLEASEGKRSKGPSRRGIIMIHPLHHSKV